MRCDITLSTLPVMDVPPSNTDCQEAGHYSDAMECSRMIRTGRDRPVKAMRAMHLKLAGLCVSKVETSYHICRKCLFCWKTRLGDAHQQKAVYGSRPDEETKHACPHTHTRTQGPTHANSTPLSQNVGPKPHTNSLTSRPFSGVPAPSRLEVTSCRIHTKHKHQTFQSVCHPNVARSYRSNYRSRDRHVESSTHPCH